MVNRISTKILRSNMIKALIVFTGCLFLSSLRIHAFSSIGTSKSNLFKCNDFPSFQFTSPKGVTMKSYCLQKEMTKMNMFYGKRDQGFATEGNGIEGESTGVSYFLSI